MQVLDFAGAAKLGFFKPAEDIHLLPDLSRSEGTY